MDPLHGLGSRVSVLTPPFFHPLPVVKSGAGAQEDRLLESESAPRGVQGRRLVTATFSVSLPLFVLAVLPLFDAAPLSRALFLMCQNARCQPAFFSPARLPLYPTLDVYR